MNTLDVAVGKQIDYLFVDTYNICLWIHSLLSYLNLLCSLTKLMVSLDLPRWIVTNQMAFDQRDLYWTPEFKRAMDRCCHSLVSKPETSDTILLPNCMVEFQIAMTL